LKILVTGSSGQVGTNLGLALLKKRHVVSGIDRRANSWTGQIPTLIRDIAAEGMPSLAELRAVNPAMDKPDLMVHLAANAKVHELVVDPRRAHENTTTAFHVFEFCRLHQVPVVFSSSREVYGNPAPPTVAEDAVDIYQVRSPYAACKLADEMLLYTYAHCYGLRYLIFRLSNVYGRYDNDLERMTRVIHIFIDQMRRGEPITIYDRHKRIDFTYIDDCVAGLMLGIEKLAGGDVTNQTFNISSGSPATLIELAEEIAAELGVTPEIIDEPIRPGEISFYVADLTKIKRLLGYEPQVPFAEGIRRTVQWSLAWEERNT
ncbi:MAG: NAD-dependent epimerase/dehydratase family protein, partial [Anaerolineae bacterium]|nr:NAD-dependent epimerase/dehydratase family protein [Anaerolineae bacterium]